MDSTLTLHNLRNKLSHASLPSNNRLIWVASTMNSEPWRRPRFIIIVEFESYATNEYSIQLYAMSHLVFYLEAAVHRSTVQCSDSDTWLLKIARTGRSGC